MPTPDQNQALRRHSWRAGRRPAFPLRTTASASRLVLWTCHPGIPTNQLYRDPKGFAVNREDEYEMIMVHHRPLQDPRPNHGMGNYLLYMTAGGCPSEQ